MRRLLISLAVLLVLGAATVAGALWWFERAIVAPGPLAADLQLVLPRGQGVEAIAEELQRAGVIGNKTLFLALVWEEGAARRLKAGEYRFAAASSLKATLDLLVSGRTVVRRLTVPEGLNTAQVVALLNAAEGLQGALPAVPEEGALLPETWNYSWGDERGPLLDRMRKAMSDYLAEAWARRDASVPLKTPREALVLASIVEKETGVAAERPLVAAVFINRLRRNMRLQSDPTVAYGVSPVVPLDRPLTRADLERETPWNTYRIDGLPATPIANPGRAAIDAVLHPARADYLYFVADGSGGHAFARTLAEHNANVAKWRARQ